MTMPPSTPRRSAPQRSTSWRSTSWRPTSWRSAPSRCAPRSYRSLSTAAVAVLLALGPAAAGCADGGDPGQPPRPTPASTGTGTSTSTGAGSTAPTGSGAAPSVPPAGELTVTGEVVSGVEPNCLILRADGREYQLVAGSATVSLPTSGRVTVTGHPRTDLATTCMQGVPLVVRQIRPA